LLTPLKDLKNLRNLYLEILSPQSDFLISLPEALSKLDNLKKIDLVFMKSWMEEHEFKQFCEGFSQVKGLKEMNLNL